MIYWLLNNIYKLLNYRSYKKFNTNLHNLEEVQKKQLHNLLRALGKESMEYESFTQSYKVTTYDDWRNKIDRQKEFGEPLVCKNVNRYQPTSGSSGKQKWIPYTPELLDEFDKAASAWMYNLFLNFPQVMKGSHYWSLSWIPTKDRKVMGMVDDGELFSFWKKLIINKIFSVPKGVALLESSELSFFATATFLVSDKNLSLISVWSPSFLISIVDNIFNYKSEIINVLETGSWQDSPVNSKNLKAPKNIKAAKILQKLTKENQAKIWSELWPKLSLISCWDTGLAINSFEQLKNIFPNTQFQGKGLWSTEAVVTIPFEGNFLLAYRSHFYEFKNLENDEVIPSWKLKAGMRVMPILSTGSGFLRYLIKDVLLVDKMWNNVPCLTFQGRAGHMDLVGEKLEQNSIAELIRKFNDQSSEYTIISLLACNFNDDSKPFYSVLVESSSEQQQLLSFENELKNYFHYRLAKEVGQLGDFKVITSSHASDIYFSIMEAQGMIKGNIKIEAINLVTSEESKKILGFN